MVYNFLFFIRSIRLLPHFVLFHFSKQNTLISYDITRWMEVLKINGNLKIGFFKLMLFYPEFRNLFYYRVGHGASKYVYFLCPKMNTLFINCSTIGRGLFIQHGFATIIEANSIGDNCWINQQVTIGFSNSKDCPTILDNVTITAGAKVIGNVIIGNNSVVGANSVVVKNVPDNCVVVGVPAVIIKKNGIKVKESL
ncbi:MAG: serine acetyltransferase [Bacteroidota bacterium]